MSVPPGGGPLWEPNLLLAAHDFGVVVLVSLLTLHSQAQRSTTPSRYWDCRRQDLLPSATSQLWRRSATSPSVGSPSKWRM
jgi:hypothetical protein